MGSFSEFSMEITELFDKLKADEFSVVELITHPERFAFKEPWIVQPKDRLKSKHRSFGRHYKFGINPNTFVSEQFPLLYIPKNRKKAMEIVPLDEKFYVLQKNKTYKLLMKNLKTNKQTDITISFDENLEVSEFGSTTLYWKEFFEGIHELKISAYYVDNLLFFAKISRPLLPAKIILFYDFEEYINLLERTSWVLFDQIKACWKLSELF